MNKYITTLMALFLLFGATFAASPSAVTNLEATYYQACGIFTWDVTQTTGTDWDLNLLTINATGPARMVIYAGGAAYTSSGGVDINVSSALRKAQICVLGENEQAVFSIRPVDSNTDYGSYVGQAEDLNIWEGTTETTQIMGGSTLNAGRLFVYFLFVALGAVIGIIIIVFLAIKILSGFGLINMVKFGKNG